MALWNCSDFHHLGESVFCRNVCAGDRKASVSGTFSAYSVVSAPPRENPDEESRVNKGLLCSNTEVFMSWPHAKFAKYAKWPTSFPLRTLREVEFPRSVSQASTWITVKNADAPTSVFHFVPHRCLPGSRMRAVAQSRDDHQQVVIRGPCCCPCKPRRKRLRVVRGSGTLVASRGTLTNRTGY